MIKSFMKNGVIALAASVILTSCYSYTTVVGDGAQGTEEVTEWNHYALFGLAPLNIADTQKMAGEAENYTIHTRHTFINGLVNAMTFGVYAPTTTTVTK